MVYDNFFKDILIDSLKDVRNLKITAEHKIGTLPLKIDLVIEILDKSAIKDSPTLGILLNNFKDVNIIEYKSSHDNISIHNLTKIIGYLGLYSEQHKIKITELKNKLSSWYITCLRPPFLDELITKELILIKDNGLYKLKILNNFVDYYILVISELEIKKENYPLLLNLEGKKLINLVQQIFDEGLNKEELYNKYIYLNYFLHFEDVSTMTELKQIIEDEDINRNIKMAVEHLGVERVIEAVGISKVVDVMGVKRVVKELGAKRVIKELGAKRVVKELGVNEIFKLLLEDKDLLDSLEDKYLIEFRDLFNKKLKERKII